MTQQETHPYFEILWSRDGGRRGFNAPAALMDKEVKENIYSLFPKFCVWSPYVQIQYSLLSKRELKEFSKVSLRFTILNFLLLFLHLQSLRRKLGNGF